MHLLWPIAAALAAAGLCAIAPQRSRSLYFAPVAGTAAFICTLAALGAALVR